MDNNMILEESNEYDHNKSKTLLEEVRDFFQGKLKMVGIEWITKRKQGAYEENSTDSIATLFIIRNAQDAPFVMCNAMDDVDKILSSFEQSLVALADNLYALVDNNRDLDEESKNSLEGYGNAVDKAVTVFGNQRKRRLAKIRELSTVDELRDELKQLMSEILANYIVIVLVDALYGRIKNNAGEVYQLAIKEINKFLVENGVCTKEVQVGELLNPEFVEPTPDSSDNVTEEFVKFDTIDEIRRYPYYFSDGTKILDGAAKIWRRKD